jgi:hypothetical protein
MQLNAKITDSPQLLFLTSEEKTYEFFLLTDAAAGPFYSVLLFY